MEVRIFTQSEVEGLLLAIWLSMCDFLLFSRKNGHIELRQTIWSFSLTFDASVDFSMEVPCIQGALVSANQNSQTMVIFSNAGK